MKFFAIGWAAMAAAAPLTTPHENRPRDGVFVKRSIASQDSVIPVRIYLAQRNLDRGYDHVMDVSSPSSPNYGKHWTVDQVNAEFAPSNETIAVVKTWLTQSGITDFLQSANKGWITFDAPARQVSELLNAQIFEYHDAEGTVRLGTDEYFLPQDIADAVDYITPGATLSSPVSLVRRSRDQIVAKPQPSSSPSDKTNVFSARASTVPAELQHCGDYMTPDCVRALYNLPYPSKQNINIEKGDMGMFEEGSTYGQASLDDFFAKYAPYVPNGTHPTLVSINNATAPTPDGGDSGEADIDLDLVYAVLGNAPVTLFQTTPPGNQLIYPVNGTFFESFLDAVGRSYCTAEDKANGYDCGTPAANLTKVISMSYSTPELFQSSAKAQERACGEFMKLALRGHTTVAASGDYGIATNPANGFSPCTSNGCIPANLQNDENPYNGTVFNTQFPGTCPYVLAVGATMLYDNQTVYDPEYAMDTNEGFAACNPHVRFASSGGFSNYFDRPTYQKKAVERYLNKSVPDYPYYISNRIDVSDNKTSIASNNGVYARNGRGFPDVSCNGDKYKFFVDGEISGISGTSLSTPIWAAVIALINSERYAAGKSAVGFVNPVLYEHPEAFNDITHGSNPGCGTEGFPAAPGWDPVTGLGTPNWPKLKDVFLCLP